MTIKDYLPRQSQRKWFFFVMGLLFLFYPYLFVDFLIPSLPNSSPYFYLGIGLLLFAINITTSQRAKLPSMLWMLVTIMVVGCAASFIATGGRFYYHKVLILFTAVNLIVLVNNRIGLLKFFRVYNRWILLMAFLGTIGFIIAFLGVPPIFQFDALNDGRPVSSWIITLTKAGNQTSRFIRYSGFFDEPGAMGYWGMFALAMNRLFFKDNKYEIWLLILLLFTFSMGFIAQALFFVAYFYLVRGGVKSKLYLVLGLCIFLVGAYSTKNTQNSFIFDQTFGRFEAASKGNELLEGTSRGNLTEIAKEEWHKNPVWGNGQPKDAEYMSDNLYENLAFDGIAGTVYLYFPYIVLLFWGIKRKDWDLIGIVFFCALAIFHRPIQAKLLTFFIFYSIPTMYAMKIKQEQQIQKIPEL